MKKYLYFFLFFILSAIGASAQQLIPSVVSTSGGFYANGTGMLSFTVGEMAAIETYTTTGSILTQGFQQAWDFSTSVTEHPNSDFAFGVYPNPSDGNFYLVTESDEKEHIVVRILDVLGKQVMEKAFDQLTLVNVQSIDLSNVASGTYLISFSVRKHPSAPEGLFMHQIQIIR